MDFAGLASHVDKAFPDAELRSDEASVKLRRPSSFERIRPPQVYERGRTGFYEESSKPRSRSGWRLASSSRSSRGSLVSLIDSRKVLGRDMQEQRSRDISVLDEKFPKVSGLGSGEQTTRTHSSRHKYHKKQPSDDFNQNGRPKAPSRAMRGTMVIYKERKAEHQPTEGSSGKGREGTLNSIADVARETVLIRRSKQTDDESTEDLPGSPHESDCDPTSSPSKGTLVVYQGEQPRDGTPERLRKTYHRKGSDVISMSQGGASVTHKVEEERDEATKQLPGRYGIDFVDTIDSQTGALVIWRREKLEDKSAEGLPKRVGRRVTERVTNQVRFEEMSSNNRGRDLPGTSINQGLSHEASLPISEDDPYGSNFGKTDLSLEDNLAEFSDESLRPRRDRRAPVGALVKSFSDGDITTRRAERRISDRYRPDSFDADISSWSDNGTSSDDSKYFYPRDRPRDRPQTLSPMRRYEKAPEFPRDAPECPPDAAERRRKGKHFQRKDADPEEFIRRRARAGHQQKTGENKNGHKYINRNSTRLEGSDAHRAPATDPTLAGSSQLIRGKASPADMGMRTLLVYRAVLFATLCALAADTSCVHETELGRRIVQVL